MSNFKEIGYFIAKSALVLTLSACSEVNASQNATLIPQRVLLGCREVQFGDTGLGLAFEMGGGPNSTITIGNQEEVNAVAATILPLNEYKNIEPEVCVYEYK